MPASTACRFAAHVARIAIALSSLQGCGVAVRGFSTSSGSVGVVRGTVIAADGRTPIADAVVRLDGATGVTTRSAPDGSYTLKGVPAGSQVIVASRGVFSARALTDVRAQGVTRAPAAPLRGAGKLAFVRGAGDAIEDIADGLLGNPMDELRAKDLRDAAKTSRYRMLFLNCGLDESWSKDSALVANLREFVGAGGTLYASDHASPFVQALVREFSVRRDGDAQYVTATLVDPRLAGFVGRRNVDLHYDLGAWSTIVAMPASARVLVRGTVTRDAVAIPEVPLAIDIPFGAGRVIFTTFHNRAGVTEEQVSVLKHFVYLP